MTRPGRGGRAYLTVVTFHRVLPAEAIREYPIRNIAVTVDEFAWFVDYFRAHYTCATLATAHRLWVDREPLERPLLAITFDDGQRDNFMHARPILARAGVPASFFVPVEAIDSGELLWHDRLAYAARSLVARDRGLVLELLEGRAPAGELDDALLVLATVQRAKGLQPGDRTELVSRFERAIGGATCPSWDGLMTWDQLRELAREGHEIGSHSLTHPIMTLLDAAALERETSVARKRIQAATETACESFCYPNGDQDVRVREAVRNAGHLRAVTTAWGINGPGADALALSRCDIQSKMAGSTGRVALRLSPFFSRFAA